jgi:hypothetical protein
MTRIQKIITLWGLVLAGFLAHNIVDLLPIFWAVDVAVEHAEEAPVGMMAFMAIITYTLPAVGIVTTMYGRGRRGAALVNILAAIMALFNVLHDGGELIMAFNPVQVFVLPFVLCFSILLALESFKWYKEMGAE